MKILKSALWGLFAALVLAGCSSELPGPETPGSTTEDDADGCYMSLDIRMPDGKINSRSSTVGPDESNGGTEVGSDAENTVSSALIVLAIKDENNADRNLGFIAAGQVASNRLSSVTSPLGQSYKALSRIYKTNLNALYDEWNASGEQSREVYVFVFCNPTASLVDALAGGGQPDFGATDWLDLTCEVVQGESSQNDINTGIWGAGSFLMNNVSLTTRELPKTITDWDIFNSVDNPFHLSDANTEYGAGLPDNSEAEKRGAIKVERSVARFDFKDASPKALGKTATYNVLYHFHNGVMQETEPLVAVQLQSMSLVNMSNSFYYLPRVSTNGRPAAYSTGYEICGPELPWVRNNGKYDGGNYVVGPYAVDFYTGVTEGFTNYFNFPFFDNDGLFNTSTEAIDQWDVYSVESVLAGNIKDNYEGKSDYTVWRYVTENVIPGGTGHQVNGISTGVVFKGRLYGGEYAKKGGMAQAEDSWEEDVHELLAKCLDGEPFTYNGVEYGKLTGDAGKDPILYYFDGRLYLSWPHIRQAAIQASITYEDGKIVEINRSNSLYRAVFGEGPIPTAEPYFYIPSGTTQKIPVVDPNWETGKFDWLASADYAWSEWDHAGKPVGESITSPAPLLSDMRMAVTDAGITIYQSAVSDGVPGYYCYYFYWNRHNDNNLNGVMGPMEFDVVRNNVYKLSVNRIARLGHPRIPANDPDNPTPETPDESDDIYLDVRVEVADWAVRINQIEF